MKISVDQLAVFVTSHCTLNCRLCQSCIPRFREVGISFDAQLSALTEQLKRFFESVLYRVGSLQITGGEPLCWKPLPELLQHLKPFSARFDTLRIITNGTLLPSQELLAAVAKAGYPIEFYVDYYGALSSQHDALIDTLARSGIPYIDTQYTSREQHGGGWIDFGDLSRKAGGAAEAENRHKNCRFRHGCIGLYDGAVYACSVSAMLYMLRGIECDRLYAPEDAAAAGKIAEWTAGKSPFEACAYCAGFDIACSKRYPAAEQLPVKERS